MKILGATFVTIGAYAMIWFSGAFFARALADMGGGWSKFYGAAVIVGAICMYVGLVFMTARSP